MATLARKAIEETKRGVFEDKATKNLFACEYVVNNMRHTKTVGIIKEDPVGITEIAEPVGVVCWYHPGHQSDLDRDFQIFDLHQDPESDHLRFPSESPGILQSRGDRDERSGGSGGAPENCIQWIENPSMEATTALMNHPGIATILATGGNAMVKAAYSCGKPALGVGAGNVPCYINESCDQDETVNDVVLSKAFDNGMICASESAVFIDESIYESMKTKFARLRSISPNRKEKSQTREVHVWRRKAAKNVENGKLNPTSPACRPMDRRKERLSVPEGTSIIGVELSKVGPEEPMSREKLSPVLGFYKVKGPEGRLRPASRCWNSAGLAIAPRSIAKSRRWPMPLAIKSKPSGHLEFAVDLSAASATSITPSCLH
jgi:acetaldehyde dehydrogenase/alcohol dehydrogenase